MDGFFHPERVVAADLEQARLRYLRQRLPCQDGWMEALEALDRYAGLVSPESVALPDEM